MLQELVISARNYAIDSFNCSQAPDDFVTGVRLVMQGKRVSTISSLTLQQDLGLYPGSIVALISIVLILILSGRL